MRSPAAGRCCRSCFAGARVSGRLCLSSRILAASTPATILRAHPSISVGSRNAATRMRVTRCGRLISLVPPSGRSSLAFRVNRVGIVGFLLGSSRHQPRSRHLHSPHSHVQRTADASSVNAPSHEPLDLLDINRRPVQRTPQPRRMLSAHLTTSFFVQPSYQ